MNTKQAVQKAIELSGGQAQLAIKLGIKQPSVSYWVKTGQVSAEYAEQVEKITGISRHELRPQKTFGPAPQAEQAA